MLNNVQQTGLRVSETNVTLTDVAKTNSNASTKRIGNGACSRLAARTKYAALSFKLNQ